MEHIFSGAVVGKLSKNFLLGGGIRREVRIRYCKFKEEV